MAVFKREGSPFWFIEFTYKGHKVRQSSGMTKKRDAEERERLLRQELKEQILLGKVADMSLGEAIDRYYDGVIVPKGNKGVATRELYALNQIRQGLGASTSIAKLSARVLADYKDSLLAEKKAPATVNRYLATIKAILRKAKDEWGTLAVVPTIKLLPLDNARYRWLTEDEEKKLLPVCAPHLRDLVVFLMDTGARLREATLLIWTDVDLDRKPRAAVRFMETKSGKPRGVPLSTRVEEMLRRLKAECPEGESRVFLYRPVGRGGVGDDGTRRGKAIPFNNPFGTWDTARKRVGLEDVNLHDLRHTFASRLVMRGVPLLTVSKLLGHASIQMTMRYAHLAPDAFDAAIDLLEGGQPRAEPVAPEVALAPVEDRSEGNGRGEFLNGQDGVVGEEGDEVGTEEAGTSANIRAGELEAV
ncbi:tyrosine-type recombinase/integrase [Magnetospirillum fulvum]|uniref:Site-specific recombinase XerD n=1 Tax=Magnetospirillum fulvum TaxID=1082 RepID=A0A1H6ITY1_MAGFU|nr:site-specific integrase [Magnetospirillum fulvum]SEH52406.1 Site-specific recombinase XerD [Magnetospirillum fulvum]